VWWSGVESHDSAQGTLAHSDAAVGSMKSKRWVSTGLPRRTVLCGVHSDSRFSVWVLLMLDHPSTCDGTEMSWLHHSKHLQNICQQFSLLSAKSDNTGQSWCQELSPTVFCGVYHNHLHNSSYHMLVPFIFTLIYHVYVKFLHSFHFSFICKCMLHIFFTLSKTSLHTRKISSTFTGHLSSF